MLRLDGIVFTLINLLILYVALRHFLIGPIQSVLEQRKQLIDGQFASAAGKEEQALQLKEQYEGLLADAKDQSRKILEDSRVRAQKEYESRVMEAEKQAGHIMEKARKDVDDRKRKGDGWYAETGGAGGHGSGRKNPYPECHSCIQWIHL